MRGNFNLAILTYRGNRTAEALRKLAILLTNGSSKENAAKTLNFSAERVFYLANKLEKAQVITRKARSSSVIYAPGDNFNLFFQQVKTVKEGVIGVKGFFKEVIRVHDQRFIVPIAQETPAPAGFWDRSQGTRSYKFYLSKTLGQVTIEKSGGNIKIYVKEKQVKISPQFRKESERTTLTTLYEVIDLLSAAGITLKLRELKEIHLHAASELEARQAQTLDDKKTIEIELNRNADGDLNARETPAKIWIDRSKGTPELESNDLDYSEKLALMPETIAELRPLMAHTIKQQYEFSQNLATHLEVLREIKEATKELAKAAREK